MIHTIEYMSELPVIYYSNYCERCKHVLDYLVKSNEIGSMNAVCVDKRKIDPKSGALIIFTDNGKQIYLPPNINNSVPSVVLGRKQNFRALIGVKQIMEHFKPQQSVLQEVQNGEPMAVGGNSIGGFAGSSLSGAGGGGFMGGSLSGISVSSMNEGLSIHTPQEEKGMSKQEKNTMDFEKLRTIRENEVSMPMNSSVPSYF